MVSIDELPIWLVDDDPDVRESLGQWLEVSDLAVRPFAEATAALAALAAGDACGVLVSDVKMPGMDGLALLDAVQRLEEPPPVVLITGHGDVPMAVAAMQVGAWDFVEKDAVSGEIGDPVLTLSYGTDGTQYLSDTAANWRNEAPCGN